MLEPDTKIVIDKSTGSVKVDNQMLIHATVMHAGVPVQDDGELVGLAVLSELLPHDVAHNLNGAFARDFIAKSEGPEVKIAGHEIIDWLQQQVLPMIHAG